MSDATAALAGHTTKYNIPLSHFEHKYIKNCTDGKELERIYKELISGEIGSFAELERLTLDRIRDIKPNSQILRNDKAPLDKSALPDEERQQFDDFLNQMKGTNRTTSIVAKDHQNNGTDSVPIRTKSIVTKSITPSAPVITNNGKQKRIVPRSYDEWGKLDQKISRELSSDDEDDDEDEDDDHDAEEQTTKKSRPSEQIPEKSQRLQMAEQHRLTGNTAFKSNNYQQAIDSYTKSITLDNSNPVVYMNRAIAHFKLDNYDASITDCSQVLSKEPHHIKALFRRASCLLVKRQYDEAKRDLDILLTVDQENNEAKNLLKTIPTVQKTKSVRIPITEDDGDDEEVNTQPITSAPVKIPILEVEEEEDEEEQQQLTNQSPQSMNIDIPQKSNIHARPCIDSQEASPAMFDHHFHHRDDINQLQQNVHTQLSSLHPGADNEEDDDDGMALGDEAGAGFIGNMSDDDNNVSHSLNVSPTMDDDDPPDLIEHKPLQTPPLTSPIKQILNSHTIDRSIAYTMNENPNRKQFSSVFLPPNISNDDDDNNDLYDNNHIPNNYSSTKQNTISTNPFENNDNISSQQRSSITNSQNDQISNSNFCPTIQSWLRDYVTSKSNSRSSSNQEKPWTRSARPWSLDKLHRDIEKFNRLNDFTYAIEASKKMLKNGVLDYHNHADHIVSTLFTCAQAYSKKSDHVHAIQYATEALQYNKTDSNALLCRARAFENENFLLLSYADYARIPSNDYSYALAQNACQKLSAALMKAEGEKWRDKLPKNNNDDENYLTYIKTKVKFTDNDPYDWYRQRGNQLYLDACFVLAIRCYTYCIELKPDVAFSYANRAACYLKVFEPEKTLDDCDKALQIDPTNLRALYRKAWAYKISRNDKLYRLTLKDFIKLQPNNQTVLNEYYSSRHEQIPRGMRRLRTNTNPSSVSTSSSSDLKNSKATIVVEENNLSYEELEQIRTQKTPPFSTNTPYQFTQQLTSLKTNDIKGQCSLILRIPAKGLYKIVNTATSKLVEIIINACRTMVYAEKRYQQEHKSSILSFSYIQFCYNILIELTTLQRIEPTLLMLDQNHRSSLDDVLSYYASLPSLFKDINKLDRLRK